MEKKLNEDKEIIWQPKCLIATNSYEFKIDLERNFSNEMLSKKSIDSAERILNEYAAENFKLNYKIPYNFFEETGLLKQIYLGGNGKWLELDRKSMEKDNESPLEYWSHNMDTRIDVYDAIRLFELWTTFARKLAR